MSFPCRGGWCGVALPRTTPTRRACGCAWSARRAGSAPLTHPEALEAAIAHGWIDGTRKRLDERHYVQRFTPRRARSKWSKINRDKAVELIERGEMTPAGPARGRAGQG